MERPLGVSLISFYYIFGAIVLLITAIFFDVNASSIGTAFGVPGVPERFMRILVAIFSIEMIYGYIRLKKWGFWLMITYSAFFGLVSFSLSRISNQHQQPFVENLIFSIIVLAYTFYVRESFFKTEEEQFAKH